MGAISIINFPGNMMAHKEAKAKEQASPDGRDAVRNGRGWGGRRKKCGVLLPVVPARCLTCLAGRGRHSSGS